MVNRRAPKPWWSPRPAVLWCVAAALALRAAVGPRRRAFDPHAILGVAPAAGRRAIRRAHASRPSREAALAVAALVGDAASRANFAAHGHPEGPPRGRGAAFAAAAAAAAACAAALGRPPRRPRAARRSFAAARAAERPATLSAWLAVLGGSLDVDLPDVPLAPSAAAAAAAELDALGALRRVAATGGRGGAARRAARATAAAAAAAAPPSRGARLLWRLATEPAPLAGVPAAAVAAARAAAAAALRDEGRAAARRGSWADAHLAVTAAQCVAAGPPGPRGPRPPPALEALAVAAAAPGRAAATLSLRLRPGRWRLLVGIPARDELLAALDVAVAAARPLEDRVLAFPAPPRPGRTAISAAVRSLDGHGDDAARAAWLVVAAR